MIRASESLRDPEDSFLGIVSRNAHMRELFTLLPEVGRAGSTVFFRGATGTGKELFARTIHRLSPRRKQPFVTARLSGVPDALLETGLFGAVSGSFDRAQGGTLFLDGVDELSEPLQARLLHALEAADVRLVTGANRDLGALAREGRFRRDLSYRLNVVRLALPLLRDRKEDIPLLADHFVSCFAASLGKKDLSGVSDEALAALLAWDWPGNVRELRNALEHAVVLSPGGRIGREHLPREFHVDAPAPAAAPTTLDEAEARFIREALARNRGNRAATARQLGVHKTTLWRKMKRYAID